MALSEATKQKLIEIAENIQKVYNNGVADGSNDAIKVAIYLTNGITIESREDGVWLVDNGEDFQLYDSKWQTLQADYAECANEAEYAYYDTLRRELKGTTLMEYSDSYAYVSLEDGSITSYGVVDYFSVDLPDDYYIGFSAKVYFTTSSYVGDDFMEKANKQTKQIKTIR